MSAEICADCGCVGRSEEMLISSEEGGPTYYFCESCQQGHQDQASEMYRQFLKRCDEIKEERATPKITFG